MAWKLKYRCTSCGYEAETYEGKGLFGQHITAVSCPDCHSIQNIVVGVVNSVWAWAVKPSTSMIISMILFMINCKQKALMLDSE